MQTLFSRHLLRGTCSAFLVAFSLGSARAIDFTPRYAASVQDGFPVRRLYFSDETQHIYLTVPQNWQVVGDGQHATFMPADLGQALITLENSRPEGGAGFNEKNIEIYRKTATGFIPEGAEQVQIDFDRVNEIQVNGWSSFEMGFTYKYFGQFFSKSVLLVDLGQGKQIRLRVVAHKEDFEKLYPQARGALGSWFAPAPELEKALARLSKH